MKVNNMSNNIALILAVLFVGCSQSGSPSPTPTALDAATVHASPPETDPGVVTTAPQGRYAYACPKARRREARCRSGMPWHGRYLAL
jgi:hypothetical protein